MSQGGQSLLRHFFKKVCKKGCKNLMVCYNKRRIQKEEKFVLKKKLLIITLLLLFTITTKVQAFTVVLDPGHGGIDSGAVSGSLMKAMLYLK